MKKIPVIVALIMLPALLFGGCFAQGPTGSPQPAVTLSPKIEPGQLFSKNEAEALVGNALAEPIDKSVLPESLNPTIAPTAAAGQTLPPTPGPTATPADRYYQMRFYDSAVQGGRFLEISIVQNSPGFVNTNGSNSAVSSKIYFEALKGNPGTLSADPRLMTVEGVGDEAFILPPGIHILFQGYYIMIGVGDPYDEANQAILIDAGKQAVKNLAAILGVPEPTPKPSPAPTLSPSPSPTASAQ